MGQYSNNLGARLQASKYGQMVLEAEYAKAVDALEQWTTDNHIRVEGEAALEQVPGTNVHWIVLKFRGVPMYTQTDPDKPTELQRYEPQEHAKHLTEKFNRESGNKLVFVRFEYAQTQVR